MTRGNHHQANLEALLELLANAMEILGNAWEGPAAPTGLSRATEAEYNRLASKLQVLHRMTSKILGELRAGGEPDLEDLDLKVKEAGRTAEKLRMDWPTGEDADGQAAQFLNLLSEAADVTVGPVSAGTINWLVASARDANLLN